MRAAVLLAFGSPPQITQFAEPDLAPDEVMITVAAAALKQLDRALAGGEHYASPKALPVICGTDGVGRTDSGERVFFAVNRRPFGAMAERAPASWTVPIPATLDDVLAAAIVNPALGAWLPLVWRAALQPGETVLVLGATGASGRQAVAAARLLGAGRVIVAGRNHSVLDALDADDKIDLTMDEAQLRQRFAETVAMGLDVIVDYVWGNPVEVLLSVLAKADLIAKDGGAPIRLVSVGEMAGPTVALPSTVLRGSWLTILGSGTANFPPMDRLRGFVAEILDRASAGDITIATEEHSLADVEACWRGNSSRRIVLRP